MKRTKEWWGRLTKEERSRLCQLERAGYGKGSSLLPDDCVECPTCSTPHSGYGICPMCSKELNDLLDKADGKQAKWKRIIRASGLIEWQCEHGVGHPDENSIERMNKRSDDYHRKKGIDIEEDGNYGWGIHGCDGCCSRDDFPGSKKISVNSG